jgi:uncharacterized protein (TIGR03790 family)
MIQCAPFRRRLARSCAVLLFALVSAAPGTRSAHALTPAEVGIVVNEADPYSRVVGRYYQQRRGIPPANVVSVSLPVKAALTPLEFARARREVQARMPASVQVLALAWTFPYRVACLSVTSAFAQGFDPDRCATACLPTPFSPYFNSDSPAPYRDHAIRPAMLIAARDASGARALIDRGIAADGSHPRGTAYLLDTSDEDRNARQPSYASARVLERDGLRISVVPFDLLLLRRDVLFFFTGSRHVWLLGTNRFLPGAIGDHLTSSGGVLDGRRQMNALAWIEAGATGSYGTVVEPCAITGKFPSVPIVMRRYLAGETLVEAYWKSVAMPSQGLFVGDPLAAPFRVRR